MRATRLLVAGLALTFAAPAAAYFPQHVDATVQTGGTVSETSSALPKTAKSATITVKPKAGDSADFFTGVQSVLAQTPSKKQRVLYCVGLYKAFGDAFDEPRDVDKSAPALRLLLLAACLELAFQTQANSAAHAAATACPAVPLTMPMKISRISTGYRITASGTPKKPSRPLLRVSCKKVAGAMQIKMRPRSRTRSLRSVVGPKLAIGFYNASAGRPVAMRTTFAIK